MVMAEPSPSPKVLERDNTFVEPRVSARRRGGSDPEPGGKPAAIRTSALGGHEIPPTMQRGFAPATDLQLMGFEMTRPLTTTLLCLAILTASPSME